MSQTPGNAADGLADGEPGLGAEVVTEGDAEDVTAAGEAELETGAGVRDVAADDSPPDAQPAAVMRKRTVIGGATAPLNVRMRSPRLLPVPLPETP